MPRMSLPYLKKSLASEVSVSSRGLLMIALSTELVAGLTASSPVFRRGHQLAFIFDRGSSPYFHNVAWDLNLGHKINEVSEFKCPDKQHRKQICVLKKVPFSYDLWLKNI